MKYWGSVIVALVVGFVLGVTALYIYSAPFRLERIR